MCLTTKCCSKLKEFNFKTSRVEDIQFACYAHSKLKTKKKAMSAKY